MAKCKNCDYPYATINNCSNCGSKNPTGKKSSIAGLIVVIIVIMLIAKCNK